MKIFAISLIKNEEDIIEANLTDAAKWADKIFVLDNGSTDDTWEIVKRLSSENDRIVAWKQIHESFRDEMRSRVFNEFRHLASDGRENDRDRSRDRDKRGGEKGIEKFKE